jgi:Spy/CpxP family protein refolding chaperone
MRSVCHAFVLLTVMLACAQLAAQEVRVLLVERFQDLNLTDEQETKITSIQEENRPKIQAAARELAALVKEEVEKVTAVLSPAQKEKLAALRDERKELRAEGLSERIAHLAELDLSDTEIAQIEAIRRETRPDIAKAMEGLRGLLTDEQRRTREDALKSGKKHREVLAYLNLSEAQKQKLMEICQQCCAAVKQEMEKFGNVLTTQQQAKLAELKEERKENVRDRAAHRIANLQELSLTEEQRSKIAEIRKEYRPKIQEAGNKLRSAIREDVQAIAAVLRK